MWFCSYRELISRPDFSLSFSLAFSRCSSPFLYFLLFSFLYDIQIIDNRKERSIRDSLCGPLKLSVTFIYRVAVGADRSRSRETHIALRDSATFRFPSAFCTPSFSSFTRHFHFGIYWEATSCLFFGIRKLNNYNRCLPVLW